jgi:aminoglycoside phosphotransferase (APT) family kinase protein
MTFAIIWHPAARHILLKNEGLVGLARGPMHDAAEDVPAGDPLIPTLEVFDLGLAHGHLDGHVLVRAHELVARLDVLVPVREDLFVGHRCKAIAAEAVVRGRDGIVSVLDDGVVALARDLDLVGRGSVGTSGPGHGSDVPRIARPCGPTGQRGIEARNWRDARNRGTMAAMRRDPGWALARRMLEAVFAKYGRVSVGRVRKVGQGLSREVFAAFVEIEPDPEGRSGAYAVFLPARHADRERPADLEREAARLERIAAVTKAIRVPQVTAILPMEGGNAVVRPYLEGIPLDLRTGRQPTVRPWEVVAEIAATIHGIDVAGLPDLPGHATRREHAIAEIATIAGVAALREAEQWALANLPPPEPASLLHGDLLGQNILLHPDAPPAVIDWEYAMRGDPAYDLAIVTRGVRQPFQIGHGLERLLEAYAARAAQRITACDVHLYEVCIVGRSYRAVIEGTSDQDPPEQVLGRVRNVLSRARAAEARERRGQMR